MKKLKDVIVSWDILNQYWMVIVSGVIVIKGSVFNSALHKP